MELSAHDETTPYCYADTEQSPYCGQEVQISCQHQQHQYTASCNIMHYFVQYNIKIFKNAHTTTGDQGQVPQHPTMQPALLPFARLIISMVDVFMYPSFI